MKSEFKLLDRGFKKSIALIPGWAADCRIFESLNLDYNYLLTLDFSPFNFCDSLSRCLNELSLQKISLFGWSMGAFLAGDFALRNPDRIDDVILLSIRRRYEKGTLLSIAEKLIANKKACLYKFYLDCFTKYDTEALNWFKKNLLRKYTNEMGLGALLEGLEYLFSAEFEPQKLMRLRSLKVLHGSGDLIAPINEAQDLMSRFSKKSFTVIEGTGHLPFLHPFFRDKICNG
jgi:pimeloyl-ACP methyl ester carboxylesterase